MTLDQPIPVRIAYWIVSVGATGRYASDIYGLDARLLGELDRN